MVDVYTIHDAATDIYGELGSIQVRVDGFCLGSFALASGTHVGCTAYRGDVPGCCRNFTPKAATSTTEIGTPLPTGLAQLSFARKVLVALPHERFPIKTLSLGWVPPYPLPPFLWGPPRPLLSSPSPARRGPVQSIVPRAAPHGLSVPLHRDGLTPLMAAVAHGHAKMVALLIALRANLHVQTNGG